MSVTLILFDVDGTVLDVRGSGRWAMTRAFETVFGIGDAEPFSRDVRFDGMTDPGILLAIGDKASLSEELVLAKEREIKGSFLDHLERRLAETPDKRVLPGVVDLLDRLAGVHHAAVGLATGNIRQGAMLKLASVGLDGYFDLGGFGDDASDRAGIGSVARRRFEEKLGREVLPEQVVLVGDSVADVEAAKANGYRSLAVGTGWVDHEILKAADPDVFSPDLSDFGAIMQFVFGTRGPSF